MSRAIELLDDIDVLLIIGTSLGVYPAAGLVHYAPPRSKVYYIDPRPDYANARSLRNNVVVVAEKATSGVSRIVEELVVGD